MNWKFHTFIFVLVVVVFGSDNSLACDCKNPTIGMTITPSEYDQANDKYYVCAGTEITFDAEDSFDEDGGIAKHTYSTGEYMLRFRLTDNDDDCICNSVDIVVGCTFGRKYVRAFVDDTLPTEVRATIKARYGELCCENCADVTVAAYQVAQIGMCGGINRGFWGVMGYTRERQAGSENEYNSLFWETVILGVGGHRAAIF
jgi:hypothetical protein